MQNISFYTPVTAYHKIKSTQPIFSNIKEV